MKLEYDAISPITKNMCVLSEADDSNGIASHMCMESGFVTTDQLVEGSEAVTEYEKSITQLMRKLRFVDLDTNLVWYPAFLRSPIAMLYCSGTDATDMIWEVAKIIELPESQQNKFPIPGQDGEFYSTMIDTANATLYDKALFENALDCFYEIITEHYQNVKVEADEN